MTTNPVALITGAARGLGEQIARRFHDEGATAIVTDLSEASARAVADAIDGDAYALDVTNSAVLPEEVTSGTTLRYVLPTVGVRGRF